MSDVVGRVTDKSNLSEVVIEIRDKTTDNPLSMNEFIAIHHGQLDRLVLCQVADIKYKKKGGSTKLLATVNILEHIPNPFRPNQDVERAVNGIVSRVLNIIEDVNHIHIGSLMGHDIGIYLNPNSLILNHIAVMGKTGRGKSYTVGVIIEEMMRIGLTAVVIDPRGDFAYMQEHYPDKMVLRNAGNDSLSDYQDIDKIYNKGKVTILNMLDMDDDMQPIYVMDVGDKLFRFAKAGKISPFLFVVDECHNFAPQVGGAESKRTLATISGEGRKFGMGLCAITQRPARINKNVLSQCNTQIILQVSNPNDVRAIINSVEGVRIEDKKKIQLLEIGQALIIGSNIKMPQYVQIKQKRCGDHEGKKVI